MALTVGSLFSGIGGLDLGLERAGMQIAWQCEIDPYCREVLQKHWPEAVIYDDITKLSGRDVQPVDVLCGGFPCQDVSMAGKRAGIEEGTRSGLWSEYARLIGEIEPRWVFIENVPGLLSIDSGRGFGRVLYDLAIRGYDAEWDCISAASVGALHRRDRIFIVAHAHGEQLRQQSFRIPWGGLEAEPGNDGPEKHLAHAHRSGHLHPQAEEHPAEARKYALGELVPSGEDVADAEGWKPWQQAEREGWEGPGRGSEEIAHVANTDRDGREGQRLYLRPGGPFEATAEPGRSGQNVPDPYRDRFQRHEEAWQWLADAERHGADVPLAARWGGRSGHVRRDGIKGDFGPFETGRRADALGAFRDAVGEWWAVEPGVGRVADGVPYRVDRLRALGNAVVPQAAEYVGRLIVQAEALP